MKKFFISATAALAAVAMVSCGGGFSSNVSVKSDVDSAAYAIGFVNGQMFAGSLQGLPGDSLDTKILLAGMADALNGKEGKISAEDAQTFLQTYFQRAEQKQLQENKAKEDAFLSENGSKEGVKSTESGLQYKVETMGEGITATSPRDTVVVHYTGKTLDGKVFDSSVERGEPATFPLDRVISGWTEGFQLVPAGSKFTLWIPAALAYGERGTRGIEPNSLLQFDCELIEVRPAPAQEAAK